jgi:hypothetical protein
VADDDALIAKAVEALDGHFANRVLYYGQYRHYSCSCGWWDAENDTYENHQQHVAGAAVAAVRDQIAAEAWERGAYAGREYQKRLYDYAHITSIAPGPPEMPRNPYRARAEALGATQGAGEGEKHA